MRKSIPVTNVLLFLLSAIFPVHAEETPPANLLPNPSFEKVTEADGAAGWITRAWYGEANGKWSVVSPGRTGAHCVSIESEQGTDAAWTVTVAVRPNTFYRLSGWLKTEEVRGAVGALLNIQNMQHVRTPPVKGTADWTEVSTVFQTQTETQIEINCLFGGWGSSTGRAWYDDLSLVETDSPSEQMSATVTIDTDGPRVEYSPMIFGGFIEHFHHQIYGGIYQPDSQLADEHGFRRDVIEAVKELKVSIIRWPGGCFASGYHWRDGVGPNRQAMPDPVWGVVDPNTFGTDEFVHWCRLIGAEPYICTNAGNGTPEEMRRWVEYCNLESGPLAKLRGDENAEPLGVRYWSIGNENWGGHEIGAKTPAEWGPLVRHSAELMLDADPNLILLAAATPDRNWTLPLLEAAGEHLDYVCIHKYWLGNWQNNATPDYRSCIVHSDGPEETICQVIDILEEAGCRGRVKIAFDEWNLRGWHHPGYPRKEVTSTDDTEAAEMIGLRNLNAIASQYTMADALFSASFLNACLRHADDVGMANVAPIVNTRGPIYVHDEGIVRRTVFHALAMYANCLESRVVPLDLESGVLWASNRSIAAVDGVATVDESGHRWAIALINRHPDKHVDCTVRFGDTILNGQVDATILQGDSPDAFNDVKNPDRVVPTETKLTLDGGVVRLPPHSLVIVRVTDC